MKMTNKIKGMLGTALLVLCVLAPGLVAAQDGPINVGLAIMLPGQSKSFVASSDMLPDVMLIPVYFYGTTEQLKGMDIEDLQQLLDALKDDEMTKKIVDDLNGVGDKIADHWVEVIEETGLKASDKKKDAQVVQEGEYVAKIKPELSKEKKAMLELRDEISDRRPPFLRQEWFRYQKLEGKWRKPRGMHSKERRHYGYRPTIVSIGFRGPAEVRGLHSSGFEAVMVFNPSQLDALDPKVQAARIGGTTRGTPSLPPPPPAPGGRPPPAQGRRDRDWRRSR